MENSKHKLELYFPSEPVEKHVPALILDLFLIFSPVMCRSLWRVGRFWNMVYKKGGLNSTYVDIIYELKEPF